MEKANGKTRIVIVTGPESTGKTELAKYISVNFGYKFEPEFAREYVEKLNRKYNFYDVEYIAKKQIVQLEQAIETNDKVIFDTGLIITKVWFEVVFKKVPDYLIEAIDRLPKIPHLLCATDLPWINDSIRENGGEMREHLFNTYQEQLKEYKFPYAIISGVGAERFKNAVRYL